MNGFRKMRKLTEDDRDAAYERGWLDSLRAYDNLSGQPIEERYDYAAGWHACGNYRWADPRGRGVAPDPTHRTPRRRP